MLFLIERKATRLAESREYRSTSVGSRGAAAEGGLSAAVALLSAEASLRLLCATRTTELRTFILPPKNAELLNSYWAIPLVVRDPD